MNPIKSPQEMLLEQAGIPHLAGGSSVSSLTAGAQQLIKQLVERATRLKGAPLDAQQMARIEEYAQSLSVPTSKGIPTNPARLAGTTPAQGHLVDEAGNAYRAVQGPRGLTTPEQAKGYEIDPFGMSRGNFAARQELINNKPVSLYDPKVKPFETRDPFLTEAMTGRKPSGTRQKPFTVNVDDLAAQRAQLESKGIYGGHTGTEAGGLPVQSTTPSADYFAQMSSSLENAALPANIRSTLRAKLGREPTEDEVNAFIANLNVLGQNYTGQGTAAFGASRPFPAGRPTKQQEAEIAAYRQNAIDSGISPSATQAGTAELKRDYPNLLQEREWGPEGHKAGGHMTPDEMRHMMIVQGHEPSYFKEGNSVLNRAKDAYKNMSGFNKFMALVGPADAAYKLNQGETGGALMSAADTVAGATMPFFKGYLPLQAITYSSELGPEKGTRDWEIENPRAALDEAMKNSVFKDYPRK